LLQQHLMLPVTYAAKIALEWVVSQGALDSIEDGSGQFEIIFDLVLVLGRVRANAGLVAQPEPALTELEAWPSRL
jgi:hypothetical protein